VIIVVFGNNHLLPKSLSCVVWLQDWGGSVDLYLSTTHIETQAQAHFHRQSHTVKGLPNMILLAPHPGLTHRSRGEEGEVANSLLGVEGQIPERERGSACTPGVCLCVQAS
jgi:hypothetical protein